MALPANWARSLDEGSTTYQRSVIRLDIFSDRIKVALEQIRSIPFLILRESVSCGEQRRTLSRDLMVLASRTNDWLPHQLPVDSSLLQMSRRNDFEDCLTNWPNTIQRCLARDCLIQNNQCSLVIATRKWIWPFLHRFCPCPVFAILGALWLLPPIASNCSFVCFEWTDCRIYVCWLRFNCILALFQPNDWKPQDNVKSKSGHAFTRLNGSRISCSQHCSRSGVGRRLLGKNFVLFQPLFDCQRTFMWVYSPVVDLDWQSRQLLVVSELKKLFFFL